MIDWARRLGIRLHPWQRWLLIHALELAEDGVTYRFRIVVVLVARQNGKTLVKMLLTLWRLYVGNVRLAVGTAQDLSQAREVMNEGLVPMMLEVEHLRRRFDPDSADQDERVGIWHKTLNDEYFRLDSRWRGGRAVGPHGPRYLIKALNRRAGRGLWNVGEVNIDELREQTDFKGWASVSKVVMAAEDAQIWCMSNAGDSSSLLLNHLRAVALAGADPSMFIAEWSGPKGCELDDVAAWAQANPSLGYPGGPSVGAIRSALITDPANVFRTEVLCQFVDQLDGAVDGAGWAACADRSGSMDGLGERAALVVEVANEGAGVSALRAAQLPDDGRVRLEVVGRWDSTVAARRALPDLKALLRPAALGWFPNGPGAALSAQLRKLGGEPIKGAAVSEACMTFADYVEGRRILQPDDPLLDLHVSLTTKVGTRGAWQFARGVEPTDAAWAAAGAVHLALNMPERRPARRVVIVPD